MLSDETDDNPDIPAGYTYFGQFIDHDITFDPTSDLQRRNDPDQLRNFRTPRLDLDNIYGSGPDASPHFYDQGRDAKFGQIFIGSGVGPGEDDLQRNRRNGASEAEAQAIIGDPRNDENVIVSQIQLSLQRFHNKVLDRVHVKRDGEGDTLFRRAQQLTQWHYQWVVVNDFLPRIVEEDTLNSVLPDGDNPLEKANFCFYEFDENPFMPVEFSVGAYRLGHSMVRSNYALNDPLQQDAGDFPIFAQNGDSDPLVDLRGGFLLPERWTLQWDRFLEVSDSDADVQLSKKLDPQLSSPLEHVPGGVNLPLANLRRGRSFRLPSGQAVARRIGQEPLGGECQEDPLWYYILAEAEQENDGRKLGPVGSRIVSETFVGLLAGDPFSYLSVNPGWTPISDFTDEQNRFQLKDLLSEGGAPLTAGELPF
jgi:hypothetical protein